ncbi:glycosyltransferase family 4 protein [Bacteroides sp.]|uniref:glycosyltransferase family 4 protein n=1 Tax=Bacteroides sp. TaxID=29523 RepID=UPI00262FD246|nr:glycosyltransferase family 4 protein [Bacteroides sp.]MDD3040466.1 glycosyltransferase family 4 protein [Bacteroides sp.]
MSEIGKKPLLKLWRFFITYFSFISKLLTHRYDLAYIASTCYGIGFLKDMPFIGLCKLACKKVVLHQHNQGARYYTLRWGYRRLMPRVYKNVKVILLSWNLYDDIKDIASKDQILICPNGIEGLKSLCPPRTPNDIPKIFFLSNLLREKGVIELLEAARQLKSEGVDFSIDMVGGETADFNSLTFQNEIESRGLKNVVTYHGPKYGDDKEPFWQNADIFVLPTLRECFPLVVCEAMQHELPCVASYEGAIPDIIEEGVTGLLFEKGNAEELANCLRKLLQDSNLRSRMGKAGYERYQANLTIDAYEKKVVECVKECLI